MLENGIFVIFGLGFVAICIAVSVFIISNHRRRKSAYEQLYKLHENLSPRSYATDCFPEVAKGLAQRVIELLSEETNIDFFRILPTEQFVEEPLVVVIDLYDLEESFMRIEEDLDISFSDEERSNITSPRDLVNAVVGKVHPANRS